ncbi:MAG: sulfite exporter TauE/SafE family protein [Burkholderiales bacterium]
MSEPLVLVAVACAFLVAGLVKGVIGLGLPTVVLALLTALLDLTTAMALLLVPSFVSNVWQTMVGGHGKVVLKRIWLFLVLAAATVWIGALALTRVPHALLAALLGLVLIVYSLVNLAGWRLDVARSHERWAGPLAGAINGVLTGMTGSFAVPGVMYLQSLGLSRDALMQAMGMLFTASTVALAIALQDNRMLSPDLALMSAGATVPAIFGLMIGQRIRKAMPEPLFRRVFFVSLLLLGGYIAVRAIGRMA